MTGADADIVRSVVVLAMGVLAFIGLYRYSLARQFRSRSTRSRGLRLP